VLSLLLLLLSLLLLQLNCHSVAVVLTPVQTKQIRINIHKRNNTKTQYKQYKNTVNTSTYITKTHTQLSKQPHITKQVKTTTIQDTHQM
jgi:capsular polysaccharide biosynthesis protein